MSPRSEEFMAAAREWLGGARATLSSGFAPGAVSLAYYAMLYAARAALSEEDRYAKTHSGTWNLFRETFVVTGKFNETIFEHAQGTLPLRMAADYEARQVSTDDAEAIVELAESFLDAIETLFPD